ncbi:NYN domain-containing protein [Chiayiivirga flava]|uniref:Uncharacterized LabA/DUF88 family protein n=1 Tax=Chiayiivirga flava TaxID=659595 RepID=A0A7W8D2B1_9GAMM|nr:NYN domain-containing protein [Chiayiivirga flava]MBB5206683.1 uncharacterized LabA/DUF88 family protein [Chiayiivirga flava]
MPTRDKTRLDGGDDQRSLAVLIDADNAQPSVIQGLLEEVAKFGVAAVKRIYGDWTSTSHAQWKRALLRHSIAPVQQFAYTSGKNATDSMLIIDAMDLMYTRRFDGFCLVSSDSDFTRLAQRLREEGLLVLGFGEKKTPEPFVVACDKFVYTEVLRPETPQPAARPAPTPAKKAPAKRVSGRTVESAAAPAPSTPPSTNRASAVPVQLILQAIDEATDETGWASLGAVGNYLTKIRPDFDPRLYGHRKLSDLIRAIPAAFQSEERGNTAGTKTIFVRAVKP